jgi:hypothetical protein
MSSLWTPGGEHEVPREQSTSPSAPADAPAAPDGGFDGEGAGGVQELPGYDELTPEQQAQAQAMAQEMAEARQRLLEVPAAEVVANHVMGLYELGAIHLGDQPPGLEEARVAIDAMNAMMEALPGRMGDNEAVLREALQQLQLAFVQLSDAEGGVEQ